MVDKGLSEGLFIIIILGNRHLSIVLSWWNTLNGKVECTKEKKRDSGWRTFLIR